MTDRGPAGGSGARGPGSTAPGAPLALLHAQIFEARFVFLRNLPPPVEISTILGRLDGADQDILKGLENNGWYPFSTLMRLDRAIASVLAPGDRTLFERLGATSARLRTEWLGEHASLVSPHAFLSTVAEDHRRFHNFGRAEYRRTGFEGGEILFFDYPELDEAFCLGAKGYLAATLELLSGGGVSVEERKCQCRNDTACRYVMGWNHRPAGAGEEPSRGSQP